MVLFVCFHDFKVIRLSFCKYNSFILMRCKDTKNFSLHQIFAQEIAQNAQFLTFIIQKWIEKRKNNRS